LAVALTLGGCGEAEDANAQLTAARIIETFQVDVGTFLMDANLAPGVVVGDDSTQYTLTGDTLLQFNLSTGQLITRSLLADEVVIERPLAGTVTIIRGRR
jgi:hypothetical protein